MADAPDVEVEPPGTAPRKRRLRILPWAVAALVYAVLLLLPKSGGLGDIIVVVAVALMLGWTLALIALAWIDHMSHHWDENAGGGVVVWIVAAVLATSEDPQALGQRLEASRARKYLVAFAWGGARFIVVGFGSALVYTAAQSVHL
jgi:hypothetical protein